MFQVVSPFSPPSGLSTGAPQEQIFRHVASHVAADFGLDEGDLTAPTRGAPQVAFARQVAMYLTHVAFAMSFAAVGRLFGRDRTTVAHACRVIEDGRDNARLDGRLAALETACRRHSASQAVAPSRSKAGLGR